jgi:hypothetical protein
MAASSYTLYVLLSIAVTVWITRTLHRNGRILLEGLLPGNETLADSMHRLLLAGFCLINVGYVLLTLVQGDKPSTMHKAVEYVSTRFGFFLLVQGFLHFASIKVMASMLGPSKEGRQPPGRLQQRTASTVEGWLS